MRGRNFSPIRSVVVPCAPPKLLLNALRDVRSAVNHLVVDWRHHPEESRFDATKRSYPWLRAHYPHLASSWWVVMANETSATLNSWDRLLRRMKRDDPGKWERLHLQNPVRRRGKASLHPDLYRLRGMTLDLTVHRDRHVRLDLSGVKNPLFWRYGALSSWSFGLAVTDRKLVFNFHVPDVRHEAPESVGVDLNMGSADFATSDGLVGSIDLKPITRVQGAMTRKRVSIQRHIQKDRPHQKRVLRRYTKRERHRVDALLHHATNEFLAKVGDRNIVLEDLSRTTEQCLKDTRGSDGRRKLAAWSHGQLQRQIDYKSRTRVLHVDPRGTSSECPRCGGRLDHPVWRRSTCDDCQGDFHRDRAAAVSILNRGEIVLRGTALSPSALNGLLELSRWGPERGSVDAAGTEDEANEDGGECYLTRPRKSKVGPVRSPGPGGGDGGCVRRSLGGRPGTTQSPRKAENTPSEQGLSTRRACAAVTCQPLQRRWKRRQE